MQATTEAVELPSESKVRLAGPLVESPEADDIGPLKAAWIIEAKRRRDDVRSGRVEPIAGEDALKNVRDSLT